MTEVKKLYGNTDAYREHTEKTKNYTDEKWAAVNSGLMSVFEEFALCKNGGESADSDKARLLVKKLQEYITANYYTCTRCILSGLGKMYVADRRFRENIDKYGEGTAEFASKAIAHFCEVSQND